jgi:transcriptional regulator with XRE-family HTH domain
VGVDELATFGAGVRALRHRRGLSQERLAELCELDQTYLSGVERGRRNLGLRNVYRIARALGMSGSDLLAEAERAPVVASRARRRRRAR